MIKNAPTGFDKRNRPALYMYIEEMVSEKTKSEGLFEKKPFPLSAEPGVYLLEWYNWPETVRHIKTY